MAIAKFNNKRNPKLCAQNVDYITRLSKASSINFHNLDSLDVGDLEQRRTAAMAYGLVRETEAENNKRIKNSSKRQDRNHNTLILSWDRNEDTKKVNEMTKKFLKENFRDARCIYTVHQDKPGQSHVHIWIDNKLENGKKLQIKAKDFYTFDEKWAKEFDKEYSTNYFELFKKLKKETFDWKKRKAVAAKRGVDFDEEKPIRYGDFVKNNLALVMDKRDFEQVGAAYDESRIDSNKRIITAGHSAIKESEFAVVDSNTTISNSIREFDRTLRQIKAEISGVDQKQIEAEISLNKNLVR